MKIRQGFVSNSSTSSFLIYGTTLPEGTYGEDYEKYEEFCETAGKEGLEVHSPECCDIYIGASWSSIKDDETGKQFKARIEEALKKVLAKKDLEFDTHELAYHD